MSTSHSRLPTPTPSKIRAHPTDRDRAFDDDFVGVVLDSSNDQRRAVEFLTNLLGVQKGNRTSIDPTI